MKPWQANPSWPGHNCGNSLLTLILRNNNKQLFVIQWKTANTLWLLQGFLRVEVSFSDLLVLLCGCPGLVWGVGPADLASLFFFYMSSLWVEKNPSFYVMQKEDEFWFHLEPREPTLRSSLVKSREAADTRLGKECQHCAISSRWWGINASWFSSRSRSRT